MGTKTFNNYEDILTFTRASKGHALRPVSYGTELVTNGDFSSSDLTGWTAYDGTLSVSSGALQLTYVADTQYVTHSITTEVGKVYVFSLEAYSSSAVNFRLQVENNTFGGGTVEQGYEAAFTSTASTRQIVFVAEATTSVIEVFSRLTSGTAFFDNISVKEVTFDESGGRLTLFEHPNNVPRVEYIISDNKARFANINNHLLSASIGVEPQSTEFDVLVGGRKIGDITNNGDVSAFDASQYLGWFNGTLTNQTYIDYIEGTLNPYIEENLEKYVLPYPAGINRLGLLVEESRTNLVPYSEFSSGWGATRSTLTANAVVSPDRASNGSSIKASTDSNDHYISDTLSVTATNTYTASVFAKAGGKNWFWIWNGSASTYFDLTSGVVGTVAASNNTSAEIKNLGNGWYRCSITFDAASSSYVFALGPAEADSDSVYVGDNSTEEIYIYGAQLEEGTFPTSYIKTTGSTATRSADVATIEVANFGDNIYEGTIFFEGQDIADNYGAINANGGFSVWFGSNTNNYIAGLYHGTSGLDSVAYYKGSGTLELADANLTLSGGDIKTAMAFDLGKEVAVSINGSSAVTETATVPTAYNSFNWKIKIGSNTSSTQTNVSVYMREIKFYPRRLTNAQLQDLTT